MTGTAGEESLHAWVIAEIDGIWYNLDPTWDAAGKPYRFFLVGGERFSDHVPGETFCTEAFRKMCPLSKTDCPNV